MDTGVKCLTQGSYPGLQDKEEVPAGPNSFVVAILPAMLNTTSPPKLPNLLAAPLTFSLKLPSCWSMSASSLSFPLNMAGPIYALSLEMLDQITACLPPGDLPALALTNRSLHAIAERRLYAAVGVTDSTASELLRTLQARPDLARQVQHMYSHNSEDQAFRSLVAIETVVIPLIQLCPRLISFKLDWSYGEDPLTHKLFAALSQRSLQALEIVGLWQPLYLWTLLDYLAAWKDSLQILSLWNLENDLPEPTSAINLPHLKSLDLIRPQIDNVQFQQITKGAFPSLKNLWLELGEIGVSEVGVLGMLSHCGGSVEHLGVDRMWIEESEEGGDCTFGRKALDICPDLQTVHLEGACFDESLLQKRHNKLVSVDLSWTKLGYLPMLKCLQNNIFPALQTFRMRVEGKIAVKGALLSHSSPSAVRL